MTNTRTRLQWKRLRAKSGPGDTTADGRFEIHRSGLRGQNHRWEVRDLTTASPTWNGRVFSGGSMAECRRWVEEQSR